MSVYKPKNSPYYQFDFVWQGRRIYGTTGCASKREALEYERRQRSKAILPRTERPSITVDEACGLYAEHGEQLPSWPTIRYMLADMIAGIGADKFLSEVSQRDLQRHFAARRHDGDKIRSNATINREVENCRSVWRNAETLGFDIGEMPNWKKLTMRVPKVPPRVADEDEEAHLFGSMADDAIDVVRFALVSGWRRAEVIGLRWTDLNLPEGRAKTRIKGGDIVVRPLDPTLVAIIANQPKVGPFVFTYVCRTSRVKRRKGERYPMTIGALRVRWKEAKEAAEIEGLRFHDLRHTAATRMLRATGNLAAVSKALQHSNIKTTMRYAHVMEDDVRNAISAGQSLHAGKESNACNERDITLSKKA